MVSSQLKVSTSVLYNLCNIPILIAPKKPGYISFEFNSQSPSFSLTFSFSLFIFSALMIAFQSSPSSAPRLWRICSGLRGPSISCELTLESETKPSSVSFKSDVALPPDPARIGSRVRVKAPVRVYHVPRVAELELSGMEGEVKQNLLFWRGKSLTANRPFKVEFVRDVEGRGIVKFVAHLDEDEFEFI